MSFTFNIVYTLELNHLNILFNEVKVLKRFIFEHQKAKQVTNKDIQDQDGLNSQLCIPAFEILVPVDENRRKEGKSQEHS